MNTVKVEKVFRLMEMNITVSYTHLGMCLLMLTAFLFAMYEKDGLPLEKVLKNMITVKFIRPPVRKYQMENLYEKKFIMVRKKKGGQKSVKKKKR